MNPALRLNLVFALCSHRSRNVAVPDKSKIATTMFTAPTIAGLPTLIETHERGQPSATQRPEAINGMLVTTPKAFATTATARHVTTCNRYHGRFTPPS